MLACIIPSMFMSPDSLPQACRGAYIGMNYEASLLVSLIAATEMSLLGQNNPSVLVVYRSFQTVVQ